jgi:ornithine cyclodeaminase/alanine dehydrogenase-like protein (mu-crystallin family)
MEIEKSISLSEAIDSQRKVFGALSRGEAVIGSRGVIGHGSDTQFAYIARASEAGPTVIKFGSVTPSNSQRGVPVVQSHIGILDSETGSLQYFVHGDTVRKLEPWRQACWQQKYSPTQ